MNDNLEHNQSIKERMIKTRFAPSPTGDLHLGHLYAAKVAHDLARDSGGHYLLRFEDIDITRVKNKYYDSILEDLYFFGFKHDETPISQLNEDRAQAYNQAITALNNLGVTYPCFCSRKDIARELLSLTNAPHAEDYMSHHYPGACRHLTEKQVEEQLNLGKVPSIRINATKAQALTGPLTFTDLIHGQISVDHQILGDCVLARKDIGTSYHIASVVDDDFQGITHVTRGEDLLESTHLHRVLQSLLNFNEPIYMHHPLVVDDKNKRLAKRIESISIKSLRNDGYDKVGLEEMMHDRLQK